MAIWAALGKAIGGAAKSGAPKQMGANLQKWSKQANIASNIQKSNLTSGIGSAASSAGTPNSSNPSNQNVGSPNSSQPKSTDYSKNFGNTGLGGAVKGLLEKYSLAHGIAQGISSAVKKQRAKSMIPTYASAPERALFGEVQRMRRASQTNMPWYQTAAAGIEEKTAANRAFKMGGRSALGALNANLQAQKAQISQQAAANAANLIGQENEMAKYAGSISRDASLLQQSMESADAAALQSGGMKNILASIGSNIGSKQNSFLNTEPSSVKAFKKKSQQLMGTLGKRNSSNQLG